MHLHDCPNRDCLVCHLHLLTFKFTVVEEVTVLAGVKLFGKECQQIVIELELRTHLMPEVVNAV